MLNGSLVIVVLLLIFTLNNKKNLVLYLYLMHTNSKACSINLLSSETYGFNLIFCNVVNYISVKIISYVYSLMYTTETFS